MGRVKKAAEKDWFRSVAFLVISSHPHHHPLLGPAPKERWLPPPGRQKKDGDGWAGCACVCVEQTWKVSEDFGMEGGLALKELRPFRSWTFLATSILILIIYWRSARAEWLEWREGWLQRSGASSLRGARWRMLQIACGNLWERARGAGHEAIVLAARRKGVVGEDGGRAWL